MPKFCEIQIEVKLKTFLLHVNQVVSIGLKKILLEIGFIAEMRILEVMKRYSNCDALTFAGQSFNV